MIDDVYWMAKIVYNGYEIPEVYYLPDSDPEYTPTHLLEWGASMYYQYRLDRYEAYVEFKENPEKAIELWNFHLERLNAIEAANAEADAIFEREKAERQKAQRAEDDAIFEREEAERQKAEDDAEEGHSYQSVSKKHKKKCVER